MSSKIFVNLPVHDLNRSISFFTRLGFTFNPQFTDENAACMVVSEDIFVMLLVEKFFKTFTAKEIGNAHQTSEVILSLFVESRAKVDELVNTALQAGGKPSVELPEMPAMYARGFRDPDGHQWEIGYMDFNAVNPA